MKKTIFISGVHGVGKTYYSNIIINRYQNFERITASSLIKRDLEIVDGVKRVSNIDDNQKIMIKNFLLERESNNANFLFDGHFVLVDTKGHINDIDENVFKQLNLDEIILFTDKVETIYERLKNRDSTSDLDIIQLENIQAREKLVAEKISKILEIPLNIITLYNKNEIVEELINIVSKY